MIVGRGVFVPAELAGVLALLSLRGLSSVPAEERPRGKDVRDLLQELVDEGRRFEEWRRRELPLTDSAGARVAEVDADSRRATPPGHGDRTVDTDPPCGVGGVGLWWSVSSAADHLGLSDRQVRYLVASAELRACRVGRDWRIDPESVRNYVPRSARS